MFQNSNLWVFLIILAFSTISWIVKKLQEQAALKAAKDRAEARRDEALRTGRDPAGDGASAAGGPGSLDDAQARLRELAQRRQAQLRQLREREAAARGAEPAAPERARPAAPAPVRPVTAELWPGGPVIVLKPGGEGVPAPQPVPQARPKPVRTARAPATSGKDNPNRTAQDIASKRAAQEAVSKRAAEQLRSAERRAADRAEEAEEDAARAVRVQRATASRAVADRAAGRAAMRAEDAAGPWQPPTTANGWRDAFIAAEVLGPCVAQRRGHLE